VSVGLHICRAVVLMGVCGSGKSTVGLALAEKCGGVFLDADDFHPQANIDKMKRGEPLDDADRAPWLATLAALLSESSDKPVFLACSALKSRYREILSAGRGDVQFVHLHGTPELIRARLRARPGHFMPETLIDSQFAALETPQEALSVDIDQPVEAIVATIIQQLNLPAQ
jgi:carbohydrate kinase (thermoresistant glucokinase family)